MIKTCTNNNNHAYTNRNIEKKLGCFCENKCFVTIQSYVYNNSSEINNIIIIDHKSLKLRKIPEELQMKTNSLDKILYIVNIKKTLPVSCSFNCLRCICIIIKINYYLQIHNFVFILHVQTTLNYHPRAIFQIFQTNQTLIKCFIKRRYDCNAQYIYKHAIVLTLYII